MRNLVAKHNFNRDSTHQDRTKYKRLQSGNDLYNEWFSYLEEKEELSIDSNKDPIA